MWSKHVEETTLKCRKGLVVLMAMTAKGIGRRRLMFWSMRMYTGLVSAGSESVHEFDSIPWAKNPTQNFWNELNCIVIVFCYLWCKVDCGWIIRAGNHFLTTIIIIKYLSLLLLVTYPWGYLLLLMAFTAEYVNYCMIVCLFSQFRRACELFGIGRILAISNREWRGTLILKGSLDYEIEQSYSIRLNASVSESLCSLNLSDIILQVNTHKWQAQTHQCCE